MQEDGATAALSAPLEDVVRILCEQYALDEAEVMEEASPAVRPNV